MLSEFPPTAAARSLYYLWIGDIHHFTPEKPRSTEKEEWNVFLIILILSLLIRFAVIAVAPVLQMKMPSSPSAIASALRKEKDSRSTMGSVYSEPQLLWLRTAGSPCGSRKSPNAILMYVAQTLGILASLGTLYVIYRMAERERKPEEDAEHWWWFPDTMLGIGLYGHVVSI